MSNQLTNGKPQCPPGPYIHIRGVDGCDETWDIYAAASQKPLVSIGFWEDEQGTEALAQRLAAAPAQEMLLDLLRRGLARIKNNKLIFGGRTFAFDVEQPDWATLINDVGWESARAAILNSCPILPSETKRPNRQLSSEQAVPFVVRFALRHVLDSLLPAIKQHYDSQPTGQQQGHPYRSLRLLSFWLTDLEKAGSLLSQKTVDKTHTPEAPRCKCPQRGAKSMLHKKLTRIRAVYAGV